MKKLLGLLVAAALFVPAFANAEIKLYGQFDVMGYAWDGSTLGSGFTAGGENFSSSDTLMRAILGANFGVTENVEGNVTLSYMRFWGQNSNLTQQGQNNVYGPDSESAQDVLDTVKVAEANLVFKNLFDYDTVSLKLGRFFYGEKGNSIFYFGPKDLSNYSFTMASAPFGQKSLYAYESGIDGAVVTYDNKENLKVDVGYSKLAADSLVGVEKFDIWFGANTKYEKANATFANGNYKFDDMLSLGAYIYDFEYYHSGYNLRTRIEYAGLKPQVKVEGLTASLEFSQMFIDPNDGKIFQDYSEAYLAKLDVSYELNENLTPRLTYIRTGENFFSQFNDVYLGLIGTPLVNDGFFFAQLNDMDFVNVGADYKLNKFKFLLDYLRYNTPSSEYYPFFEIDLRAEYSYSSQITFKAGLAYGAAEQDADLSTGFYTLGASYKF